MPGTWPTQQRENELDEKVETSEFYLLLTVWNNFIKFQRIKLLKLLTNFCCIYGCVFFTLFYCSDTGLYMAAWCRGSTNNRISMIYTHWEVGMFFLPTLLIPTGHSSDRSPLVCCFTTLRQTGWEVTTYLSCIISICQAMPSLLEGVSVYLMYNFIHLQTCNSRVGQLGVESLGKSE